MEDGYDLPIPVEASMVLILGETGAGKSYFIRKLTSNPDVKVGHSLESCTQRSQPFEVIIGGTNLLLIDTPGFDDSVRSDADVILEIATSLSFQTAMGIKLLGLIYLHDITAPRMRGSLRRELEMLKLIAGPQNYRNILLVTTKWGDKSRRREYENRQFQLEENYWEDMMIGGAACHRFEGSADSAKAIVSQLNFRADVVLALQRELSGDAVFSETSVGRYAEQSRSKIKAELDAMSSMSRVTSAQSQSQSSRSTPSQTVVELEQTLQSSALDSQKMGVRLDDQVREWIKEAVREEKEQSRQRPSATKAMTAVLAKTSSFFRSFRTGPYQGGT
ncbi:hypothetical protein H2200_007264 [Cladophialophora chaetospira]|uniref:G domain-containing protein n=1 Tax=Cladophialophora chaetospira TaxID=386627 RepID=A0AA39CGY2_9EURO|nr:hypothetical protein H2200_007264 [Cladophialophora chaetospira]